MSDPLGYDANSASATARLKHGLIGPFRGGVRMRWRVWGTGFALGLAAGCLVIVTASAASINVAPTSVPIGGTVTVSGDVLGPNGQPGCQVPGQVTLISGAFAGQGSFMNMDVETMAGADGKFSVAAKILPGVAPGTYSITGRCGGGNLGVQATLTVTPAMPGTGDGTSQRAGTIGTPSPFVPIVVVALAAAGLMALGAWYRRQKST
jgi:hypothetical protein